MRNGIAKLWMLALVTVLLASGQALAADSAEALIAAHFPDTQVADRVEADVDGDGTADAAFLIVAKAADSGGSLGVDRVWIGAVSGKTGEWLGDLGVGYENASFGGLQLGAYPVGGADGLLARGITGGSVSRTVAALVVYRDGAFQDLFAERALIGLSYELAIADGPAISLTLENGARYAIVPDKQLYVENGWTDASGKLQPSLGNGFDENTGFSNLEPLVSDGELVLLGAQTIRGAHKMDELATLKTAWHYDGQAWAVESVLVPLQGVTVTPEFLTPLYYNPDGGLMFHMDFACPAVNEKYLPLRRIEEGESKAAALKPCPYCAYPYVSP